MQESVPSPSVAQSTMAFTLFDEWARAGLADVVLCPGSRSTPLSLSAARTPGVTVHVRLDERSAGFFALGRALATSRPVVIVVTSGTAAAELHAAVAEADLARVPLVVVTADRPPELHGVGAAQTIDQRHLYGAMVRRFEEPGVARAEAESTWRPLASRLWNSAAGGAGPAGPVHLNLAFVEPLVASPGEPPPPREDGAPWHLVVPSPPCVADLAVEGRRVLAVVGAGVSPAQVASCGALGWVVVGDATARGSEPYADPLLRDDEFAALMRPDLVVRLGGLPASRVVAERLRSWAVPIVALRGAGAVADPDGVVSESRDGLPDAGAEHLRGDADYSRRWREAVARVERWLQEVDAAEAPLDEPAVAREVVSLSSWCDVPLVVGSSMPVRDVEWWAPMRVAPTYANRGANGIDGVVSTALGVACGGAVLGLVGDLTLLHDTSGLVDGLGSDAGCCVLIVVDNRGGGIFSFLPQAHEVPSTEFEKLFATPRGLDIVAVARGLGHAAQRVATRGELRDAVEKGLAATGVTVVVADVVDRDDNVARHDALVAGVRSAWRSST